MCSLVVCHPAWGQLPSLFPTSKPLGPVDLSKATAATAFIIRPLASGILGSQQEVQHICGTPAMAAVQVAVLKVTW